MISHYLTDFDTSNMYWILIITPYKPLSILSGKHKGGKLYAGLPSIRDSGNTVNFWGLPVAKDILHQRPPLLEAPLAPSRPGVEQLALLMTIHTVCRNDDGSVFAFLLGGRILPLGSGQLQKRGQMTSLLISPLLIAVLHTRANGSMKHQCIRKGSIFWVRVFWRVMLGGMGTRPKHLGCRARGRGTGGMCPTLWEEREWFCFLCLISSPTLGTAALTRQLRFLCDSWWKKDMKEMLRNHLPFL